MLWRCTQLGALSLHVFMSACGRALRECMEDSALFLLCKGTDLAAGVATASSRCRNHVGRLCLQQEALRVANLRQHFPEVRRGASCPFGNTWRGPRRFLRRLFHSARLARKEPLNHVIFLSAVRRSPHEVCEGTCRRAVPLPRGSRHPAPAGRGPVWRGCMIRRQCAAALRS